ncbi:UDP-glycosyltransferase [Christiangramia fulva]|uniref:UDP-glycosyltransferase n=1 Tax=Christiangramia fulva TaxID=2126553 RepID=A0A2R3Z0M5_9FLAO|nr:UDP-glycosyltransferase [Christiangramia fulva]AVR43821.1 UDP-glycosyltransferase [Christiangramia fulva]
MKQKKVFVIIPDGVSLRNFLFTDFPKKAREKGLEIVYWNATPYDISAEGEREIKLRPKPRAITDLYKRAKIISELNHFRDKFNDPVYDKYKFASSNRGWKNKLKNLIVSRLIATYTGEEGLKVLRERMQNSERKSAYYKECKKVLEREKPDLVFCANQRPVNAIAPVTAAQDLGITTTCFIFSWDNLPKATKVIDSDYYFVWGDYMKKELLAYYPYIQEEQVKITGTPQFEIHYKDEVLIPRQIFCEKYNLDPEKDYLCFSGDDITTSPHDEVFLRDVAEAVRGLNEKGEKTGIIFRRCPVDLSGRYDEVLSDYQQEITSIDPQWSSGNNSWDTVMPTREDMILQTNIIEHSFMVINIASSMVFDFAARNKPCAYINYIPKIDELKKDVREIYDYVHFRSMKNKREVYWIDSKADIIEAIKRAEKCETKEVLKNSRSWFNIINLNPFDKASDRISEKIKSLVWETGKNRK